MFENRAILISQISTSLALIEEESADVPGQPKNTELNDISVPKSVEKEQVISTTYQPEAQQSDGHSSKNGTSNRENLNTKLKKKPKIEEKKTN